MADTPLNKRIEPFDMLRNLQRTEWRIVARFYYVSSGKRGLISVDTVMKSADICSDFAVHNVYFCT